MNKIDESIADYTEAIILDEYHIQSYVERGI